jgi:hypothetical protein
MALLINAPMTLLEVKSILDYGKYVNHIEPFGESGAEQIVIGPAAYLEGPNHYNSERQVYAQLVFHNDIAIAQNQEIDPHLDTLELLLNLPIHVPSSQEHDLFQLLNTLNNILPVGSLGVSEENNLYFCYKWQILNRQVSGLALLEILSQAFFFAEKLGYHCENLVTSKKTLQELLQEELQLL